MSNLISLEFFQNAIIAGILISIISGIIGTFIVTNKLSGMTGGIAHSTYGGLGIAVFLGINPIYGAFIFSILTSMILVYLSLKEYSRIDSIVNILWAFGMAIGIIFIDLTPGYVVNITSFLFGSILSITKTNLIAILILDIFVALFTGLFFNQLIAISFDRSFSKISGINVNLFFTILMLFISISIVFLIQLVGLILVLALLTIPVLIAEKFSNNIKVIILLSIAISLFFNISGLLLSIYLNLTAGAVIILIAIIIYFYIFLIKQ